MNLTKVNLVQSTELILAQSQQYSPSTGEDAIPVLRASRIRPPQLEGTLHRRDYGVRNKAVSEATWSPRLLRVTYSSTVLLHAWAHLGFRCCGINMKETIFFLFPEIQTPSLFLVSSPSSLLCHHHHHHPSP